MKVTISASYTTPRDTIIVFVLGQSVPVVKRHHEYTKQGIAKDSGKNGLVCRKAHVKVEFR